MVMPRIMNRITINALALAAVVCMLFLALYRNEIVIKSVANMRNSKNDVVKLENSKKEAPKLEDTNDILKQFLASKDKEYDKDFDYLAAMDELNKAKVAQDDPRLIQLIRNYYIEPPSGLPYNLKILDRKDYSKGQAPFVDSRLNNMEGGFFVECGAFTGEERSNTLFFEKTRKWTGLLIEADPQLYATVRSKNRNAFTVNACLNTEPYPAKMNFNLNGHMGRVNHGEEVENWIKRKGIRKHGKETQCFPLYSLLLALNHTRVDFLSLDIEGDELYVIKTIPFERADIRMMTVEVAHEKGGDSNLISYLRSKGYQSLIKITRWDGVANDVIFRKQGIPHKS